MPETSSSKDHFSFYLISLMIGAAGLLFSRQFEDPWFKGTVVLLCVGIPLFVVGHALARYRMDRVQRSLAFAGVALLTVSAAVIFSGYTEGLVALQVTSPEVGRVSRILGVGSLALGLCGLLITVLRSHALMDELTERFGHVARHMREGFVLIGKDGRVTLVNESVLRMAGVCEEDVLGHTSGELSSTQPGALFARFIKSDQSEGPYEYQVSLEQAEEIRQFSISHTPIFDQRDLRVGTIATVRDVTERLRLSQKLEEYSRDLERRVDEQTRRIKESEGRLRELLLHMNEGFLTLDRFHHVVFTNDRFNEMLQTDEGWTTGKEVYDFLDPPDRKRLQQALKAADKGSGEHVDPEYTFLRHRGGYVEAKVSIARIQDPSDSDLRFSLVVTDVRELKEMQHQLELHAKELEGVNRDLRKLDEAKDVFLTNVSHELRTPLSTLQGYMEMWEDGMLGGVSAPQRGALTVMSRNADRLATLINEMLHFSRMEISGVRIRKSILSPGRLISECVSSARPQVLSSAIGVDTFVSDELSHIWGDREKLGQVVDIILSNAFKFSPTGSLVQIHVTRTEGGSASITVSDTGIGIEKAHQHKVFEKFFQVDDSLSRRYSGTGIGLSIAKNIVEAHGGHIKLESKLKEGSTFTVVLPSSVFDATSDDADMPELNGLRLVVASMEEDFTQALSGVLTACGCEVHVYSKAYEAIRGIRELRPDVVLIDEILPDLQGQETVRLIREDISMAAFPLIYFTSAEAEEETPDLRLLGRVEVLSKPFTARTLIEMVRKLGEESDVGRIYAHDRHESDDAI